jgi:hypothetical protein
MNLSHSPRRRGIVPGRFGVVVVVLVLMALADSSKLFAEPGITNLGVLSFALTNNTLAFAWSGGPDIRLQSLGSLNATNWTNVPGTVGRHSATRQLEADIALFRLFKPGERVPFPLEYVTVYHHLRTVTRAQEPRVLMVYGNDTAAAVTNASQRPYPYGSVFMVEYSYALRDAQGNVVLDPNGNPQRGVLHHLDVMKKGPGFGEMYGTSRAGEWEFVAYYLDGSYLVAPQNSVNCAACHVGAGVTRDFVFRGRF